MDGDRELSFKGGWNSRSAILIDASYARSRIFRLNCRRGELQPERGLVHLILRMQIYSLSFSKNLLGK